MSCEMQVINFNIQYFVLVKRNFFLFIQIDIYVDREIFFIALGVYLNYQRKQVEC